MEYQTYRQITKTQQSNKQKHANRINFPNRNYDFFANNNLNNPIAKPPCTTKNQPQEIN